MKKNYFFAKSFLILAASSLIVTSCMTDTEGPLEESILTEKALEVTDSEGGENLKKGGFIEYKDSFVNQIIPFIEIGPEILVPYDPERFPGLLPTYLPGIGEGKARTLGKVYSYINQKVLPGTNSSEGTELFQFQLEALEKLGISNLPDEVHAVTVSEGGHALFFRSGKNVGTIVNDSVTTFTAKLEVVGGVGKYENASGEGEVKGWYDQRNGYGESMVTALLKRK